MSGPLIWPSRTSRRTSPDQPGNFSRACRASNRLSADVMLPVCKSRKARASRPCCVYQRASSSIFNGIRRVAFRRDNSSALASSKTLRAAALLSPGLARRNFSTSSPPMPGSPSNSRKASASAGGGGRLSMCILRKALSSTPQASAMSSNCSSEKPSVIWPMRRSSVRRSHVRGRSSVWRQAPCPLCSRIGCQACLSVGCRMRHFSSDGSKVVS
ncbi:hypothetical protein D3C87_1036550 [compost metagenome]